ncbi:peptidoglycan-binding domain-containing protein [Limimaricola variabilis]|uniref:peptidoglycan-binding domain-containing protein n=1 Tax=Limimaricola variabilis TaxID=1492771 RepID=UPI002AC8AD34|nr:peptidoglycan-binding domain-containing protein [Limimaricola variabilis]WPY94746.1 peptidoglycan-binding domain-containing protein [Limimaricola variabilis]
MRFPAFLVAATVAAVAPAQAADLDREGIFEVQILLRHLGHDPGGIDGVAGPALAHAIRAFQAEQGLPVTGRADAELQAVLQLLAAGNERRAFLSTPPPIRMGFWQRHAWPSRMGGY